MTNTPRNSSLNEGHLHKELAEFLRSSKLITDLSNHTNTTVNMALPMDDGSEQRIREMEGEYTEFLDDTVS